MNILEGVRKEATMSFEDNKTVIRRFLEEAVIQGNLDVIDTSFAPNLIIHFYNTPPYNHASFRKLIEQMYQAMAGNSFTIYDLIAEGDTVAARYSYSSPEHYGQFGKNSPTGEPLQLEITGFFHFEQGKVTEVWYHFEGASLDLSPE
jgi:predicted ester cyclase